MKTVPLTTRKSAGFTLVELMIAIGLSVLVLAVLGQILISNNHAFKTMQEAGFMQDGARVSQQILAYSIRNADHWGGVDNGTATTEGTFSLTGISNCDEAWILDLDNSVVGIEGAASLSALESNPNLPGGCITDYVEESDLLLLKYADPSGLVNDAGLTNGSVFVRSSVAERAIAYKKGSSAIPSASLTASTIGVYNYPLRVELYYLRKCAVKTPSSCKDDIPTLMRLALNGTTLQTEVLASGVEQMQFEYGIDDDMDGKTDRYATASAVTDWSEVTMVRLGLLVRSEIIDSEVDLSTKKYQLPGDMTGTGNEYSVPAATKKYRRQRYVRDIEVRNRTRNI